MPGPTRPTRLAAHGLSAVLLALTVLLALAVGGCAKYHYVLREPPEARGAVVTDQAFETVDRPPLRYAFRVKENRLVARVFNPTDGSIRLIGDRSVAVDPDGQSHPLQGQTIAPGSYAQLILPPPRPRVRGFGPRLGVGLGVGVPIGYRGGARRYRYADPYFGGGLGGGGYRDYTVYDEGDSYYWSWKGETVARFTFAYEGEGGDTFAHSFVVARRKAE